MIKFYHLALDMLPIKKYILLIKKFEYLFSAINIKLLYSSKLLTRIFKTSQLPSNDLLY